MAQFIGEIPDPNDPESVAEWSRSVADLLNGQLSIGEPISHDTVMHPNGVKGHMLGSFVTVVIGTGDLAANITCTHNLNVPNKLAGGLNVGWLPVRWEHDGTGVAGVVETISCNYRTGDAVTANAIDLRFYAAAARTVADATPLTATLWFFPTTR